MMSRFAVAAGFVVVLAVTIIVDARARRPGSAVRPLGVTVAAALRTRTGRVVVFGLWLWLGWHFLAR
jgi:hypothetical protein